MNGTTNEISNALLKIMGCTFRNKKEGQMLRYFGKTICILFNIIF